jgi:hypothetical protein
MVVELEDMQRPDFDLCSHDGAAHSSPVQPGMHVSLYSMFTVYCFQRLLAPDPRHTLTKPAQWAQHILAARETPKLDYSRLSD